LVLPPKLAPIQVVIVPIYKSEEEHAKIVEHVSVLKKELEAKNIRVKFDDRDTQRPGFKFAEHELRGVPVRLGIGPKDLENGKVELARRDVLTKTSVERSAVVEIVVQLMEEIQAAMYNAALQRQQANSHTVNTWAEFEAALEKGGFVYAHWDGTPETETEIKNKTKATIRCIPLDNVKEEGKCILSGKPSQQRVVFARAY
jgi:prolyl-tRNA synthetase